MHILDFNIWYEKLVFVNSKVNKLGRIGLLISKIINIFLRALFNCDISPSAIIGRNVKIPHAVGIVIGSTAIIGDNTVIMPNVVIGAKNYPPENKKRHATIGKNVLIGANAVIIGDIVIGDNCIIGAGARITKDIDAGSTIV